MSLDYWQAGCDSEPHDKQKSASWIALLSATD